MYAANITIKFINQFDMDTRILKTAIVIFIGTLTAAFMPIFAQWYHQQTGMWPYGVAAVGGIGGLILSVMSILKIWGEIK
jgi:hypothetical protein